MTSTEKFKQRYPYYPIPPRIEEWEMLEEAEAWALRRLGITVMACILWPAPERCVPVHFYYLER